MRNRLILRFVLVAVLLAGGYIALRSTAPISKPGQDAPTCSTKEVDECGPTADPGGMFWENVSRQFISTIIVQP
jgi:hypothetical protein